MKRFFGAAKIGLTWFSSFTTDLVLQWLLFPFLLALAGGVGIWSFLNLNLLGRLAKNRIPEEERLIAVLFVAGAFLLIVIFYSAFIVWYRRCHARWPGYQALSPLHRWLSFLLSLPFLAVLLTKRIERQHPIFVVFLIAAAAVAWFPTFLEIVRLVSSLFDRWRRVPRGDDATAKGFPSRLLEYVPVVVVFCFFVIYSYHMSMVTVTKLQGFRTQFPDMTIYTNILYQSAHGNFLGCSLLSSGNHAAAHFDPILILISPLYLLYPRPEFLAVFQSIWLGLGVFPAFWLGRRVLGSSWAGVAIAAIYALHPSLQRSNFYEFHSLALISPSILLVLFLLEARYYKRLFALLPFVLMIREDVSLMMCFVGVSAILTNRKEAWVGATIILLSIIYFITVKTFFMQPGVIMSAENSYNYRDYFKYMIPEGGGVSNMIISMLTNPVYTLHHLFSLKKFAFVLILVGPLLFVPLLAKTRRVMLIYSVIFFLLATKGVVYSIMYHYQIIPLTFLIGLLPYGIKCLLSWRWFGIQKNHMMAALLATLVISTYLGGSMFGAVTFSRARKNYSHVLTPEKRVRFEKFMAMLERIEPDASVTVTDSVAPYLASRKEVYCMHHYRPKRPTDYLLLHKKSMGKKKLKRFLRLAKKGVYDEIDRYKDVILYRHVRKTRK